MSDAAVIGHICHIYAVSDNGPRGNPSLTEEQRNAPSNLILMCGHHHPLVDKQFANYPADKLIDWKRTHEAKFRPGTAEALKRQENMQQLAFLSVLSNREIDQEIGRIRIGRYFQSFPTQEAARTLAARVEKTELVGVSTASRARALAWCARLLSSGESVDRARYLLSLSRELAATPEADIAEAFIVSATDRNEALKKLWALNTPAARSAALRIITIQEAAEGALEWVQKAGLILESFDAEGKFTHLMNQLEAGRWDDAIESAAKISSEDLTDLPVLGHSLGLANLILAIPEQLRSFAVRQVPFEVVTFALASDTEAAWHARRKAISHFEKLASYAVSIGAVDASNIATDYALWLKLRDPLQQQEALEELRANMRDDTQSLRRLHFALQFGLELDLGAIGRKIEQHVALAGKATSDVAFARFALALAQGSPKAIAEYIDMHRDEPCLSGCHPKQVGCSHLPE